MDATILIIVVAVASILIFLMIIVAITLSLQLRKPRESWGDINTALQNLSQSVQQGQTQIAVLTEKVAHIEPITESWGDINTTLQNLSQSVQQGQTQIAVLTERVAHIEPITRNLSTTLTDELSKVQQNLASLQACAKARQDVEQQTVKSVKRLEMIIAGTQSKGVAGENIVELVFAKLPIEWQVRDFTVNGKSVEFGLRLPR